MSEYYKSLISDDEVIKELIKDLKRKERGLGNEKTRLKPNLNFFQRTVNHMVSNNKRISDNVDTFKAVYHKKLNSNLQVQSIQNRMKKSRKTKAKIVSLNQKSTTSQSEENNLPYKSINLLDIPIINLDDSDSDPDTEINLDSYRYKLNEKNIEGPICISSDESGDFVHKADQFKSRKAKYKAKM